MDNHSRFSQGKLMALAMESDAQIYTIAVCGPRVQYVKNITSFGGKQGLLFLDDLAAKTGGLSFEAHDRAEVARAAAGIGRALRNQYIIGYVPQVDGRNGKWRKIKVRVAGPGMRAYARVGYRLD